MKQLLMGLGILLLGALVLSPAIGLLDLDPMPGDIAFKLGETRILIPIAYSLCASSGLALLYYFLKR
jgi:hypothetical protein